MHPITIAMEMLSTCIESTQVCNVSQEVLGFDLISSTARGMFRWLCQKSSVIARDRKLRSAYALTLEIKRLMKIISLADSFLI